MTDSYRNQEKQIATIVSSLLVETSASWGFPEARSERDAIYGANVAISTIGLTPISLFLNGFRVCYGLCETFEVSATLEDLVRDAMNYHGEDRVRDILVPELKRLVDLIEKATPAPD